MPKQSINDKLREIRDEVWKVPGNLNARIPAGLRRKLPWNNPESRRFAQKYAEKTNTAIKKGVVAMGQEVDETEQMARSFFKMLEAKLDLSGRTEAPSPEEVKEAIEQLKDVGRFTVFTALVILPGGVISLVGLELLARRFGIKGFNLIPSSFRKKDKDKTTGDEQEQDEKPIALP